MATAAPVFTPGFRLPLGQDLQALSTGLNNLNGNGTPGALTATSFTQSGVTSLTKRAPQLVTAVGATQLDAVAITNSKVIITVAAAASTKGVRLPTASTGLEVLIANLGAFGSKVYPALGGKIGAAATNATDTVLAINKANLYIALNTTLWAVQRGA